MEYGGNEICNAKKQIFKEFDLVSKVISFDDKEELEPIR